MSDVSRLKATVRTEFGKGAARRTRRDGNVPAVLYGHQTDPQHLALNAQAFAAVLRESGGTNAVLTLDIEGKEQLALTKSVVVHPIRRYIEHADLLVIKRGEKVIVDVPVVVVGDAAPGSVVTQEANDLSIEADAMSIPEQIEVSVEGAEIGTQFLAGELTLPAGSTLQTDPETLVVNVVAPAMEEEPEAAEAAEAGEAEAPAARGRIQRELIRSLAMAESGAALVVGLGNPGPQYERTRHNVGFMVADVLAERVGGRFSTHKKTGSDLLTARLDGRQVLLAKPRTYMNESGRPVAGLARFFSVGVDDVVVIHDDIDLDFGVVRLKQGGGEGGHNGLRSISSALTSKEYLRVRVGVGRPPGRMDAAAYVLKPFSAAERKELPLVCSEAADAVELLLRLGLEAAQNRVH